MKKEKNNIAYKIMNSDMTCMGYQYELGKTYKIEKGSKLMMCKNGFHFSFNASNCLGYYNNLEGDKRFFKIQYNNIDEREHKGCTDKITILEEIDILDYIRENKDTVNWDWISGGQMLTEELIREFKDYVNWVLISFYQTLSKDFIKEFKDKVNWYYISMK